MGLGLKSEDEGLLGVSEEEEDLHAERHLLYHQDAVTTVSNTCLKTKAQFKVKVQDLEPAMNDLINPTSMGFSCICTIVNVFFENDKIHMSSSCLVMSIFT